MEERNDKLFALRLHLSEGEIQAKNGKFVKNFSINVLIENLDKEFRKLDFFREFKTDL